MTDQDHSRRLTRGQVLRIVLVLALILFLALVARRSGLSSVEELRAWVDGFGRWSFAVFIAAYAVAVVALVPGSALTIAAGLIFGTLVGAVLVVIGATIGAAVAFALARTAARPFAVRVAGRHLERIDGFIGHRTVTTVLLLRLLPIVPFSASNYALGLTKLRFERYVAATAIGIIPATIAYVAFGSALTQVGSPAFWYSIGALTSLSVMTLLIARRIHRHDTRSTRTS